MQRVIILSFLYLFISSCSKNGEYVEKYNNGNNKSISIYADDKLVFQTKFHENGNKMMEGNVKNGQWDGKFTEWYDNGQIRSGGIITEDKYDDLWTYFYENGNKMAEGIFELGMKNGLWTEWNETGQKEKEFQWVNGVSGVGKEWKYYDNGLMEWEKTYQDTTDNHYKVSWWENGNKKFEGNYINQMLNGPSTFWFENGNKEQEGTYKDAKMDGQFFEWYENGNKRLDGNYKNDKRSGLLTVWNEKGQKVTEFQFTNDVRDAGKSWEYHDTGKIRREYTFSDETENHSYIEFNDIGHRLRGIYHVKNGLVKREVELGCSSSTSKNKLLLGCHISCQL